MEEIYPNVFRVLPTKVTDTKYCSFFVKRRGGNLLLPCFGGHSSIEGSFDAIEKKGGIKYQLLGDMHFAARYNDDIKARFGVDLMTSDVEAPDVTRKVKHVTTFPFVRQSICSGVEAIPTPGHRPGAVSYLVTLGKRKYLFAGDTLYHDRQRWRCYVSQKNKKVMLATLDVLKDVRFDVLLANTQATNPVCAVELDEASRIALLEEVRRGL